MVADGTHDADSHGAGGRAAWEEAVGYVTRLADLPRDDIERRRRQTARANPSGAAWSRRP